MKRMFTENEIKGLAETVIPTPEPGGLEVINVSKGELDENTGIYALVISASDKAKVLANPQNCVLAFTEEHVGTAYAFLTGVMGGAMYEYIFNFVTTEASTGGTFLAVEQTMIGISENMDGLSEHTYTSTLDGDYTYQASEGEDGLSFTSSQLSEIYGIARFVKYIRVTGAGYTLDLHYDGKIKLGENLQDGAVYFSARKPSSTEATVTFVITYDHLTNTYTQTYTY